MNPAWNELITQTAATIIGGAILFLLGLLYSSISKKTKEYKNWLSRTWQLLVGLALLIFSALTVFNITGSILLAFLPFTGAGAAILVTLYFTSRLLDWVHGRITFLDAAIQMQDVLRWEREGIQENVITSVSRIITLAGPRYTNLAAVLDHLETALRNVIREDHLVSSETLSILNHALATLPQTHSTRLKRIFALLQEIQAKI